MSDPIRSATLTRRKPLSTTAENIGLYVSDSGFKCFTVEKAWKDDQTDISCIRPGPDEASVRYFVKWLWSPKHGCNVYHIQDSTRIAPEIHSANVQEQLQGCIAPGADIAVFKKDSISPGMPSADCQGVTASRETIVSLEKDMQDADGNQIDFWLTIQ